MIPYDDTDLETMAKTVWGEARGEPDVGQIAVAWVIRNRASSPSFARGLVGVAGAVALVCRQPWQFSCWNADDPNLPQIEALQPDQYAKERDLCQQVLTDGIADPTHGAVNYYAASIPAPFWVHGMTFAGRFGAQLFYRS